MKNHVPDAEKEEIENPDYEIIRSLGYLTEGAVEMEDHYVVEGDIIVRKANIDSIRLMPTTRQAREKFFLITGGRENGIRLKFTNVKVPSADWRAAIRDAINIWNAVPNCNVHFNGIELQILDGDVVVKMSTDYAIAAADIPIGGRPTGNVYINPNIDWYNDTHEEKVYILVHELGHIVGLAHTDYVWNYEENNVVYDNPALLDHISGTPLTENDSFMDSHGAGRSAGNASSWSGFTDGDLAAIQATYGTPIWYSTIFGQAMCWPLAPTTYTLNLGTNLITTDLNVSWYIDNVLKQNSSSLTFTPTSLSPGGSTLKAVVNYGGTNYEASKYITTTPTISGPNQFDMTSLTENYARFEAPNPPHGGSFDGWTISPNTYDTPGSTGPGIFVRFTGWGQYTLTANYTMPNNTPVSVSKTVNVSGSYPSDLAITGPENPVVGSNATFSVPTPYGTTFEGWTIGGASYTTSGGTSNSTLNITFNSEGSSYLAAHFSIGGGQSHYVTKTISPMILPKPELSATNSPPIVRFAVLNPIQGATYEWEVGGEIPYKTDRSTLYSPAIFVMRDGTLINHIVNFNVPLSSSPLPPLWVGARCRSVLNGVASEWSDNAEGLLQ